MLSWCVRSHLGSTRASYLGASWTLLLLVFTQAGPPDELLCAAHGVLVGWVYLRYYQPRADGVGDSRDEFEFAALFPPPLRHPLRVLGNATHGVLSHCCCGLFPPSLPNCEPLPAAQAEVTVMLVPPPTVTTQDPVLAEKRRQRARELLEERLAAKSMPTRTSEPPASPVTDPIATDTAPAVAPDLSEMK